MEKIKLLNTESPPTLTSQTKEYSPIPLLHELACVYKIVHHAIRDFQKSERFSIGMTMEKILLECMEQCFLGTTIQMPERKLLFIQMASAKFDTLKLYFRIALDTHTLQNTTYTKLLPHLGNIGTMLGGWMKQAKNPKPIQTRT